MLLVTYDIKDTRLRTKFSRLLQKYGERLQLSVFQIKNSQKIVNQVKDEIENNFKPKFSQDDSILAFSIQDNAQILHAGRNIDDTEDLIIR